MAELPDQSYDSFSVSLDNPLQGILDNNSATDVFKTVPEVESQNPTVVSNEAINSRRKYINLKPSIIELPMNKKAPLLYRRAKLQSRCNITEPTKQFWGTSSRLAINQAHLYSNQRLNDVLEVKSSERIERPKTNHLSIRSAIRVWDKGSL